MRSDLSQEPHALAVQGAMAPTMVRKSLIPWTKNRGPLIVPENSTSKWTVLWGEGHYESEGKYEKARIGSSTDPQG